MLSRQSSIPDFTIKNLVIIVVFCSSSGYYNRYREKTEKPLRIRKGSDSAGPGGIRLPPSDASPSDGEPEEHVDEKQTLHGSSVEATPGNGTVHKEIPAVLRGGNRGTNTGVNRNSPAFGTPRREDRYSQRGSNSGSQRSSNRAPGVPRSEQPQAESSENPEEEDDDSDKEDDESPTRRRRRRRRSSRAESASQSNSVSSRGSRASHDVGEVTQEQASTHTRRRSATATPLPVGAVHAEKSAGTRSSARQPRVGEPHAEVTRTPKTGRSSGVSPTASA